MNQRKVGVLALGSHEERHGAALPLDTDAKLASHVALEAARRTKTKFLGVLHSSYELPGIDTGKHQTLEQLTGELRAVLSGAKQKLGVNAVVLVNAHGGNEPLRERLLGLEQELDMRLVFNNTVVQLEGPHGASGELSMGAVISITDASKLAGHADFDRYPEVGFVGIKEARQRYTWVEQQAREIEKHGVRIDEFLGKKLLECATIDVMNDIRELAEKV